MLFFKLWTYITLYKKNFEQKTKNFKKGGRNWLLKPYIFGLEFHFNTYIDT